MTNYKTKKKNGKWKAFGAVILSVILLAGGCAVGYGAGTNWTYKRGVQAEKPVDDGTTEIDNTQNLMQLSSGENHGIRTQTRALKVAEYQEYEIDAQNVESAHVATVTLSNHNSATDKSITLSAEFTNDYAIKNLNPSDYIKFSSTTVQSGEEFTISCLQSFRYPITIKATANGSVSANDGSKAYCTVKADYITRFKQICLTVGDVGIYDGDFESYWTVRLGLEGDEPIVSEAYTDTYSYVSEYHGQDGLEGLLIDTAIDDEDYLEFGTMNEGIKNVCIKYTSYGATNPFKSTNEPLTNQLNKYDVSIADYPLFYWRDSSAIRDFWGYVDLNFEHYAGYDYNEALNNYNKKKPTSTLWVQFTGEKSGIVYTFKADLIVNPKYMYVPATGPSFDPDTSGGIIF